ncbi:MAG: amidase [Gemmatimonadaceae bacterium]|nr:amidase [Gemmatimonadaceae bacterium]
MPRRSTGSTSRRSFLQQATASAAAFALAPSLGQGGDAPAPVRVSAAASLDNELHEVTLSTLSEAMSTGRKTSRSITELYLKAIREIDRDGPRLNSVIELNPDALAEATRLDEEREGRGARSKLHGIPILLKDNIGTADRMRTSAGSLALADYHPSEDAHVVQRLRDAGCVLIGKANMSEWAGARGSSAIVGWSGRGGQTCNPYALDRSPGGSSSGTAAAVSASFAAAAVGTETMGSIVSPSSLCGIVGMKPTVGLVSRSGIIPVSFTQDTAGPMARTVRDAAMLLTVMAGPDPADASTVEAGERRQDYTAVLDPDGLRGARIGVARNLFGLSAHADRAANLALAHLRAGGATLVDPVEIATAPGIWTFDAEVLSYELKASLDAYLKSADPSAPVRSLADVIAFNTRNRDREMMWFAQETFEYAQTKGPLTDPEYQHALALVRKMSRTDGIDATLRRHRLDAIVAPTQSPAWLTDNLLGDNTMLGSFVTPAAAGYPSLTVPCGDVSGLPVGLLFIGTAFSEATLLRLGFAFEQRAQARRAPTFLETIQLRG